jgi:c-di-GMP-binding flagellar brake protein YcgR
MVRVQCDDKDLAGMSEDFSMTGMRVRLAEAIDEDADMRLILRLPSDSSENPTDSGTAIVNARTVWHQTEDAQHLYGMHFLGNEAELSRQLREFVDYFNSPEALRAAAAS